MLIRGVAAPEIRGDEALDAGAEGGLDEAQVLRDVLEGERGDDGVLAGEGGGQGVEREGVGDGDGGDGGGERGGGGFALEDGDGEGRVGEDGGEEDGAEGAVGADEADFLERHGGGLMVSDGNEGERSEAWDCDGDYKRWC